VDTSESKVQTNIQANTLSNIPPRPARFQSIIQFAPGARSEPLQGTVSQSPAPWAVIRLTAPATPRTPTWWKARKRVCVRRPLGGQRADDFVQEVQVKSSGFEAEYGGSLAAW